MFTLLDQGAAEPASVQCLVKGMLDGVE